MFYLKAHSLQFSFFQWCKFCPGILQLLQYITSCFLQLYLVPWLFSVQVKCFWCTNMTGESQVASISSFLAQLCHWCTPGLIFTYLTTPGERYFSLSSEVMAVLLAAGVSRAFKCYLFPYCDQSLMSLLAAPPHCVTVVSYVLFSFKIEGRQATRIQNSKDQFEIDLVMLLMPFILSCAQDHYWPIATAKYQPPKE